MLEHYNFIPHYVVSIPHFLLKCAGLHCLKQGGIFSEAMTTTPSARKIPPEFGESYNYETVTKATINNAQMFMSILSLSNVISKRAEHRISKSILMSLLLLLLHVVFFNCNIYTVLLCLHVLACTSSR